MLEAPQEAGRPDDELRDAEDLGLERGLADVLGVREAEDRLGRGRDVGRADRVAALGRAEELDLDLELVELPRRGVRVVVEPERREEVRRRHRRAAVEHLVPDRGQRRARVAARQLAGDRHVDPPAERGPELGAADEREREADAGLHADERPLVAAEAERVDALGRERHFVAQADLAGHEDREEERLLVDEALAGAPPAGEVDLVDPHRAQVPQEPLAPLLPDHDRAHDLRELARARGEGLGLLAPGFSPLLEDGARGRGSVDEVGLSSREEGPVDRGEVRAVDVLEADLELRGGPLLPRHLAAVARDDTLERRLRVGGHRCGAAYRSARGDSIRAPPRWPQLVPKKSPAARGGRATASPRIFLRDARGAGAPRRRPPRLPAGARPGPRVSQGTRLRL